MSQDDVALVGREAELRGPAGGRSSQPLRVARVVSSWPVRRASARPGSSRRCSTTGQWTGWCSGRQCVDLGEPGLPYLAVTDLLRALGSDDTGAPVDAADESAPLAALPAGPRPRLAAAGEARGPVVVVIEDLQWVDCVVGRLPPLPAEPGDDRSGSLVSRRSAPTAWPPAHGSVASSASSAGCPSVQPPRPRSRSMPPRSRELPGASLVDRPGRREVAAEVLRRTGGNPYFVQASGGRGAHGEVDDGFRAPWRTCSSGGWTASRTTRADVVAVRRGRRRTSVPDRLLRRVSGLDDAGVRRGAARRRGRGCAACRTAPATRSRTTSCAPRCYDDLLPGERARLHAARRRRARGRCRRAGARRPRSRTTSPRPRTPPGVLAVVGPRRRRGDAGLGAATRRCTTLSGRSRRGRRSSTRHAVAGPSEGRVAVRAARAAGLAGEPARGVELARRAIRLCDDGRGRCRVACRRACRAGSPAGRGRRRRPGGRAGGGGRAAARSADGRRRLAALAHVVAGPGAAAGPPRRTRRAGRPSRRWPRPGRRRLPGLEVEALTTVGAPRRDRRRPGRPPPDRLGDAVRLARAAGEPVAELRAHYALASLHYYNGDVAGSLPVLRAAMARVAETGLRWSDAGRRAAAARSPSRSSSPATSRAAWTPPRRRRAGHPTSPPPGWPPWAATPRSRAGSRMPRSGLAALRGQLGRRPAGRPGRRRLRSRPADLGGRPRRRGRRRRARPGPPRRGRPARGCTAGCGSRRSPWPPWPTRRRPAARGATRPAWRPPSPGRSAARAASSGSSRAATGGRATSGRKAGVARPCAWPSTPGCGASLAVEEWQQALDAFGYGHVYEQARCHWRLAEALVAAGDRDARARTRGQRPRRRSGWAPVPLQQAGRGHRQPRPARRPGGPAPTRC